jgi:hypothetical protein
MAEDLSSSVINVQKKSDLEIILTFFTLPVFQLCNYKHADETFYLPEYACMMDGKSMSIFNIMHKDGKQIMFYLIHMYMPRFVSSQSPTQTFFRIKCCTKLHPF